VSPDRVAGRKACPVSSVAYSGLCGGYPLASLSNPEHQKERAGLADESAATRRPLPLCSGGGEASPACRESGRHDTRSRLWSMWHPKAGAAFCRISSVERIEHSIDFAAGRRPLHGVGSRGSRPDRARRDDGAQLM
jgi:hypothetical protein